MKKIILLVIFCILGYFFSQSEHFLTIAYGVALFLFGMFFLETGFKGFSGGFLEKILKKSTDRVWKSFTFGALSAALMQSSSLVMLLSISFLSAGLITLAAGVGIVFGANVGTTSGAWIIAGFGLKVNIAAYAMPMLVFAAILLFQKSPTAKGIGAIIAGLGFLFLGIQYMKDGFESFKEVIDLSQFALTGLKGLVVYILIGVLATAIMQSSHATLVIVITALSAGQISYDNALALTIGANVGTTITALIGSIGSNANGKRFVLAEVGFNIITGIIVTIAFIPVKELLDTLSALLGIANTDYTLKIALFHTLFNLVGTVILIGFTGQIVKFLERIIPEKSATSTTVEEEDKTIYLSPEAIDFPEAAKEVLYKEAKHLYLNAQNLMATALCIKTEDITSGDSVEDILKMRSIGVKQNVEQMYDNKIKPIYSEIIDFAVRAQTNANEADTLKIMDIRKATLLVAEMIKDVQDMQGNISKYIGSANTNMKDEYNFIRANLIKQLRYVNMIMNTEEEEMLTILFGKIANENRHFDAISGRSLDKLIRENLITNAMATSLMNDTAYANSISIALKKIAQTLFGQSEKYSKAFDTITQDF